MTLIYQKFRGVLYYCFCQTLLSLPRKVQTWKDLCFLRFNLFKRHSQIKKVKVRVMGNDAARFSVPYITMKSWAKHYSPRPTYRLEVGEVECSSYLYAGARIRNPRPSRHSVLRCPWRENHHPWGFHYSFESNLMWVHRRTALVRWGVGPASKYQALSAEGVLGNWGC